MGVSFNKYFSLLKTYLQPFRVSVSLLLVLMFMDIGLRILNPQVIRYYIDQVTSQSPIQTLINAAVLYIVIAIGSQILTIIMVYLTQSVSWGSTNLLREDILKHTMQLDMTYHNQNKPGDMIERVDGDVNALSNFFSQMVLQLLSNILLIVGILVALFFEGFVIGISFTIFVIIGLGLSYFARRIAVPYWKKTRERNMDLFGYIEETISGTEDIRSLGAVPNAMRKFYGFEEKRYNSLIKAITISRLVSVTFTGLIAFGITLVFLIGIPLFQTNEITIGTLFMMNYYVQQLVFPIFAILRQIQLLQQADASIERIEEIFQIETKIQEEGNKELTEIPSIKFEDVNFAYFEDNYVLNNITFELNKGETLGLIGRTGSGKTTISRLLYRLYDINDGKILLADQPLKDYKISSLRKNIGLVTQDVQLFNSSLRNNITFFDDSIDDERILEIINFLGLETWFNQLEKGLNTNITHDEVSAGQAQLIALSRIFLQDPSLIILDEASSRLDPATEQILNKAITRLIENKTTVIIAHRLSTLSSVSKIMELHFGKIIEFGDREDLENDPNSNYSKLLAKGQEVLFS